MQKRDLDVFGEDVLGTFGGDEEEAKDVDRGCIVIHFSELSEGFDWGKEGGGGGVRREKGEGKGKEKRRRKMKMKKNEKIKKKEKKNL